VISRWDCFNPELSDSPPTRGPLRRRLGRRSLLRTGAAGTGLVAAGGAAPAWAGHDPTLPTPDRPPPSSTLFSHEETRLAFRNHGMHLELLDRDITPVASHFQLIHFDIPTIDERGYSVSLTGRVHNPLTLTLENL
jgi:DMSO/TMAO reductase YedYZ molybdopterin-dependent catalytic subunit